MITPLALQQVPIGSHPHRDDASERTEGDGLPVCDQLAVASAWSAPLSGECCWKANSLCRFVETRVYAFTSSLPMLTRSSGPAGKASIPGCARICATSCCEPPT